MSEEFSLEELEKELRELERNPEESIEIKPETIPIEKGEEEKSAEELEEVLRKVEEEKEREVLMKYGGSLPPRQVAEVRGSRCGV
jgi:DNA-directed RNA polymerase specialized sigma24 family protein